MKLIANANIITGLVESWSTNLVANANVSHPVSVQIVGNINVTRKAASVLEPVSGISAVRRNGSGLVNRDTNKTVGHFIEALKKATLNFRRSNYSGIANRYDSHVEDTISSHVLRVGGKPFSGIFGRLSDTFTLILIVFGIIRL